MCAAATEHSRGRLEAVRAERQELLTQGPSSLLLTRTGTHLAQPLHPFPEVNTWGQLGASWLCATRPCPQQPHGDGHIPSPNPTAPLQPAAADPCSPGTRCHWHWALAELPDRAPCGPCMLELTSGFRIAGMVVARSCFFSPALV